MHKIQIVLIVIFWLLPNPAKAQINYVPNGNFEVIDTCPNPNIQPYRSIYYAKPWFQPFLGGNSSDLFNICDTFSNSLGVPNNWYGYQVAQDGFGYAGILLGTDGLDGREYIEVELENTLQAGRDYCISLYINLSEYGKYAIDQIQGHFSQNPVYYSTPAWGLLQLSPSFRSPVGTLLIDTVNWIHIMDTYTAIGGEKYLTLGNFTPDSLLTRVIKKPGDPPFSYYLIDNIEIYDCDSITSLNDINKSIKIELYPNPTTGLTTIQFEASGASNVEVFDINGRKVLERNLRPTYGNLKLDLNLKEFSNGIYVVKILSGTNIGFTRVLRQD